MPRYSKFYFAENTDSDSKLLNALLAAGYVRKDDPRYGDFIFDDGARGTRLERWARIKPYFYVPHTPQSWFFFDWKRKSLRVDCNFVNGVAAIWGMRSFGYPYRIEAIGCTRCDVREFTPTTRHDLLVIPAHASRSGQYPQPRYVKIVSDMIRFILSNRPAFDKVTICWNPQDLDAELMQATKKKNVKFIITDPHKDADPLKHMIERMEQADLVIGCGTAGCVSVAIGRPTVFFSEQDAPYIIPKVPAEHYKLYIDSLRFPLMAENMGIDEILKLRTAKNPRVEYWKREIIGGQFDAKKFIRVVNEILDHHGQR
jgi:hypothetical protein